MYHCYLAFQHVKRKRLLDDFEVPRMFPDDYFSLVGESRRPPYRYVLVIQVATAVIVSVAIRNIEMILLTVALMLIIRVTI